MLPSDFTTFLHEAKSATYAAGTGKSAAPLLRDSKQLEYRARDYLYRDIYVGVVRFVGQEIVHLSDRALWSLSYAGGLTHGVPRTAARTLYAALRQVLQHVPAALPLRGPARFETAGMLYECHCQGSLEWFRGEESIIQAGATVYSLSFSGGALA